LTALNALEAIQLDINPDLKTLEILSQEANIGTSSLSALKDNRALCEFSMTKANFVAESCDVPEVAAR
jgi:hypothetical protein